MIYVVSSDFYDYRWGVNARSETAARKAVHNVIEGLGWVDHLDEGVDHVLDVEKLDFEGVRDWEDL